MNLRTAVPAAVVAATLVSGTVARHALFLTSLDVTPLPAIWVGAAALSVALLVLCERLVANTPPAWFVPLWLLASAATFIAEWQARASAPATVAVVIYLHVAAIAPLLMVGLRIAAAGTRT